MKNVLHWIVPKEKRFFELLSRQSEKALEGAHALKNLIDSYQDIAKEERKLKAASIKEIELSGDQIQSQIIENLDKNFRAPIDREDIRKLTDLLDDILDLVNSVSSRFMTLSIERIDEHTQKFSGLTAEIIGEVDKGILDLKRLKDAEAHCRNILKLETDADRLHEKALSDLLHYYKNPVDVIKYKEIYDLFEGISNKCKNVSVAINSAITKHG